MKELSFYLVIFALFLLIDSCGNKRQSVSTDNLIVGKWKMVEYGSGYVNALGTHCFYKNGKADCPPETGEQHYKILKLSTDSLIRRISRQKIYADSIYELVNGEIEKYIRVTNE